MTDKINSQISAFIDDELLSEEGELLVRRLCNDEDLRQTAARYTIIGDAIRGSLDEIRADLNGSIMTAIEREPQPAAVVADAPPVADWRRLAGGGAVAAAVAVLAVLTFRTDGPTAPNALAPTIATSNMAPSEVVPSNDAVDPLSPAPLAPGAGGPNVRRAGNQQLNNYVLRHNQYSQRTMRQGPLVYRSVTIRRAPQSVAPQGRTQGATQTGGRDRVTPVSAEPQQ